jgi:hypothetical protein
MHQTWNVESRSAVKSRLEKAKKIVPPPTKQQHRAAAAAAPARKPFGTSPAINALDEEAIITAAMAILNRRKGGGDATAEAAALIADEPVKSTKERKMLFVDTKMRDIVEELAELGRANFKRRASRPELVSLRRFNFSGMIEMIVDYANADRAAFDRYLSTLKPELVRYPTRR